MSFILSFLDKNRTLHKLFLKSILVYLTAKDLGKAVSNAIQTLNYRRNDIQLLIRILREVDFVQDQTQHVLNFFEASPIQ